VLCRPSIRHKCAAMATRTSIRPRPVDISRQLVIVRDIGELDTTEGLPKEPADNAGPSQTTEQVSIKGVGVSLHS